MVGPAQLPASVVARLNTELAKILKSDEVKESFAKQGAVPTGGSPQDYADFMREESARWGEVVRRNGIKLE
jgi:tripartite-type tricarboxylate transporter receptor subunit TctC